MIVNVIVIVDVTSCNFDRLIPVCTERHISDDNELRYQLVNFNFLKILIRTFKLNVNHKLAVCTANILQNFRVLILLRIPVKYTYITLFTIPVYIMYFVLHYIL